MRVPRRQAGNALLVAALLLAGVATVLSFLVTSPRRSAGAGTVGRTPSASHNAAGPGSPGGLIIGLPGTGTGTGANGQASAGVAMPPTVTLAGAAALPSAHVHAGYTTPEDAVDGFYLALLSGTPTRACAYVTTPCPSFGSRPITGRVAMIGAVSHGGQALVEVTGTICVATSCRPLTDRVLMPAGRDSFSASWTSLTSGVYGWAASPLPCVQDAATRQWRVKLA